jgi:hypothetical protein
MFKQPGVVLALLLVVGLGLAVNARAGKPSTPEGLLTPYSARLGDVVALQIGITMLSLRVVDAPTSVYFDPSTKSVNIVIFGQRGTVEGAKEVLEDVRGALGKLAPQLKAQYGAELDDSNVTIIYRNRNKDSVELLRREGGKYITP